MSKARQFKKYDVIVKGKIVHSGITTDLKRRKEEHRQKWPNATIRQVGVSVTEESARKWEKTKKKA
jgi:predicted GIY-YIG superfamily endonuclease